MIMIWTVSCMISTFNTEAIKVIVPKELIMHSPVAFNFTISRGGRENRMKCNPYFNTFRYNSTYFTDEFKHDKVEKVKCLLKFRLSNVLSTAITRFQSRKLKGKAYFCE